MNEQQLDQLRNFYDSTDVSDLMAEAERVDLGDLTDSEAMVSYTVSMPRGVLDAAREIAAARGVSTADVLRRLIDEGVTRHTTGEASVPISKLMRLIDEARGA
ncbi:hypothetical protein V6D40_07685 [Corynebacterium sp. Q4381]|uniref:hypothetical protein n=1 Tax=Corynebacterium sp. Marseille-Q4381 TaxID=3121597 RepID=UPI002FE644D2